MDSWLVAEQAPTMFPLSATQRLRTETPTGCAGWYRRAVAPTTGTRHEEHVRQLHEVQRPDRTDVVQRSGPEAQHENRRFPCAPNPMIESHRRHDQSRTADEGEYATRRALPADHQQDERRRGPVLPNPRFSWAGQSRRSRRISHGSSSTIPASTASVLIVDRTDARTRLVAASGSRPFRHHSPVPSATPSASRVFTDQPMFAPMSIVNTPLRSRVPLTATLLVRDPTQVPVSSGARPYGRARTTDPDPCADCRSIAIA